MLPARIRHHAKPLLFFLALGLLVLTSGVQHGVTAQEDTYEKLKVFTEVLSIVQTNYVDEVNSKDLLYGAVRGMLETLDPHSSFMTPDSFKEMQVETQGSFGGLGIEITVKDRQLTVVAPIEGTPADRVGLHAGDRIVRIDDKPTKDLTLMEAVRRLRGPKGTKVTIGVLREGPSRGTSRSSARSSRSRASGPRTWGRGWGTSASTPSRSAPARTWSGPSSSS